MLLVLRVLKRLNDLKFIEDLLDRSYIIIIVPHKNLLIAMLRKSTDFKHERVFEEKVLKNKLKLIKARLSL